MYSELKKDTMSALTSEDSAGIIQCAWCELEMHFAEFGEALEESPASWGAKELSWHNRIRGRINTLNRRIETLSQNTQPLQTVVDAIDAFNDDWPCSPDTAARNFVMTLDGAKLSRELWDAYNVDITNIICLLANRLRQIDTAIQGIGFSLVHLVNHLYEDPTDWATIEQVCTSMVTDNSLVGSTTDPLLCRLSAAVSRFVCSFRDNSAKASEALEAELNALQPQMMQQLRIAIPGSVMHGGDVYCEMAEDDGTITSLK